MSENFIYRFMPEDRHAAQSPVLLLLHGTGGTENDLLDLGDTLWPGAPRLSPRGKILERGMPRFFRRLAEGIFDEADLILRTQELADFVLSTLSEKGLAGRPVVAVGYSNGANIAASLLLLRPEVLAGAILLRAMVPIVPDRLPDLARRIVFLAGGESDAIVPAENIRRLSTMLAQVGADVSLHWTPGGHELQSEELAAAKDWLHLKFSANN
jgi:phospholipase/carboxylesterase